MREGDEDRRDLKRLAMQIAVQLPSNEADALAVLALAGQLVSEFIEGRPPTNDPPPPSPIRPFSIVKR
jgi:hypothetical protein